MIGKLCLLLLAVYFALPLHYSALAVTKDVDIIVSHGVPISTCDNLQSNTQYVLAADISTNGCSFPVGGVNITLDCNGHSITTTGHLVNAVTLQGNNNTVVNCVISASDGISVNMFGDSNTVKHSSLTAGGTYIIAVQQNNHKIINNTFADPVAPYKVDDHINITNGDNLLIDNNIFLLGNYDLAIEGVGYITNSQISGNTIYVSSTGYAGMGGYWDGSTRNFGGFVMVGTKIINNKFNGAPWYYFTTATGNYRNSVDSDAQAALGNNNIFAGNTAF